MTYRSSPPPAGFGNCKVCPYFAWGPPAVCQSCAAATLEPAAPFFCAVCGQQLSSQVDVCSNGLCSRPDRYFEFNRAIAMKTGALDAALRQHKYDRIWAWGVIFARVLLGHLARDPEIATADLIVPMPALLLPRGAPRAGNDHTGWVIESAMQQTDVRYRFRIDPPVIVKTRATKQMATTRGIGERTAVANDIYEALLVVDPAAVLNKVVVVYDDVFTSGGTLNAVARRLREAGARRVLGLSLARQPWAERR